MSFNLSDKIWDTVDSLNEKEPRGRIIKRDKRKCVKDENINYKFNSGKTRSVKDEY